MTKPVHEPSKPAAAKRKAWSYESTSTPALRDFFGSREQRRRALDYCLGNGIDLCLFWTFRLLPAGLVSDIGGFLGRWSFPRLYPKALERTRASLRHILPNASGEEIERLLVDFADSQGRQRAEYSVVQRLARDRRRIRHIGVEKLLAQCGKRPVIFIGLHTSNWEVMWQCMVDMGIQLTLNYDPPKRPAQHWIVRHVRHRGGLGLFPPGKQAVRPMLRLLQQGGNALVFCDEGFGGKVRGPLFGRPPHLHGNFALVVRMARLTGALLCPVYMTRENGAHFTLHVLESFELPPDSEPENRLLEDIALINAIVEPVIAAQPAHWFFVDNRITPL